MIRTLLATTLTLAITVAAHAQAPKPATETFQLQAHGQNGAAFAPEYVKGRVALVFYWSTACAVCRDSLPELRKNLMGWRGKPFALVTVNLDAKEEDWLAYERIVNQTQPQPEQGLFTLRQNPPISLPARLPVTLVVDGKGKVVSRIEGRLAPEAWDEVAGLLP